MLNNIYVGTPNLQCRVCKKCLRKRTLKLIFTKEDKQSANREQNCFRHEAI